MVMPLSTIFQLYHDGLFYRWRKPEYPEKATDLSSATDKLYLIMMYLITLVVIGTNCTGCCKSNHHMITINDADRNEFSSGLNQNRQNTFVAGFRLEVYTMY